MNIYLLIILLFVIVILKVASIPLKGTEKKSDGLDIMLIGLFGLVLSLLVVPALSLFSLGIIPLISAFCFISGLIKLIRVNIKLTKLTI